MPAVGLSRCGRPGSKYGRWRTRAKAATRSDRRRPWRTSVVSDLAFSISLCAVRTNEVRPVVVVRLVRGAANIGQRDGDLAAGKILREAGRLRHIPDA